MSALRPCGPKRCSANSQNSHTPQAVAPAICSTCVARSSCLDPSLSPCSGCMSSSFLRTEPQHGDRSHTPRTCAPHQLAIVRGPQASRFFFPLGLSFLSIRLDHWCFEQIGSSNLEAFVSALSTCSLPPLSLSTLVFCLPSLERPEIPLIAVLAHPSALLAAHRPSCKNDDPSIGPS